MLRIATVLVGLSVLAAVSGTAAGDFCIPPKPRLFSAEGGSLSLKVIPSKDKDEPSNGTLFTLNDDGTEKTLWQRKLLNVPGVAILDSYTPRPFHEKSKWQHYVVTIGEWDHRGCAHPLVIYGPEGKIIRDFKWEELATEKEIERHSLPFIFQTRGRFEFVQEAQLSIQFKWGKRLVIDLPTGAIWNDERLKAALKGNDVPLRMRAMSLLKELPLNVDVFLPTLSELLKDKDHDIREQAVTAIGRLRPKQAKIATVLIGALKDEDVRTSAIEALAELGPHAKAAIPALQEIAEQEAAKQNDEQFPFAKEDAKRAIRKISKTPRAKEKP